MRNVVMLIWALHTKVNATKNLNLNIINPFLMMSKIVQVKWIILYCCDYCNDLSSDHLYWNGQYQENCFWEQAHEILFCGRSQNKRISRWKISKATFEALLSLEDKFDPDATCNELYGDTSAMWVKKHDHSFRLYPAVISTKLNLNINV